MALLTRLAGELNGVAIDLSQVNDEGKVRESRAIGQGANTVLSVEMNPDANRYNSIRRS